MPARTPHVRRGQPLPTTSIARRADGRLDPSKTRADGAARARRAPDLADHAVEEAGLADDWALRDRLSGKTRRPDRLDEHRRDNSGRAGTIRRRSDFRPSGQYIDSAHGCGALKFRMLPRATAVPGWQY